MKKFKLKKAQNLNWVIQNINPSENDQNPVYYLAGTLAKEAYGYRGNGEYWANILFFDGDKTQKDKDGKEIIKPVILDPETLADLPHRQIAKPNQTVFYIYECGELAPEELERIYLNIASQTKHTFLPPTVHFYPYKKLFAEDCQDDSTHVRDLRDNRKKLEELATIYCYELPPVKTSEDEQKEKEHDETEDLFCSKNRESKQAHQILSWLKQPLKIDLENHSFYTFNGKYWQMLDDLEVESLIIKTMEERGHDNYSIDNVVNIRRAINRQLVAQGETMEPAKDNLTAFNDIVLNTITQETQPHKPEQFLRHCRDYDYLTADKQPTPNFNKWLNHATKGNKKKQRRIKAGLAMLAFNRYDWQKFIEVSGKGGTGKTAFVVIAQALVGNSNSYTISLKDLKNGAKVAEIPKYSLLVSEDQGDHIGDGSEIKALTGTGSFSANPKFKTPFSFIPKVCFLMSNNRPALFTDKNGGIRRRRVIFIFDIKVEDHEIDEQLFPKLREERAGILRNILEEFNWNLDEAHKEIKEQMTAPEVIEALKKNDCLIKFASLFQTLPATSTTDTGILRGSNSDNNAETLGGLYNLFCEHEGYKANLPLDQLIISLDTNMELFEKKPHLIKTVEDRTGRLMLNIKLVDHKKTLIQLGVSPKH